MDIFVDEDAYKCLFDDEHKIPLVKSLFDKMKTVFNDHVEDCKQKGTEEQFQKEMLMFDAMLSQYLELDELFKTVENITDSYNINYDKLVNMLTMRQRQI